MDTEPKARAMKLIHEIKRMPYEEALLGEVKELIRSNSVSHGLSL